MAFLTDLIRFRAVVIICVARATACALRQLPHLRFETDTEAIILMIDLGQAYNSQSKGLLGLGDPTLVVGDITENPTENSVCNFGTRHIVREPSTRIVRLPDIRASRRRNTARVATLDNITGTQATRWNLERL